MKAIEMRHFAAAARPLLLPLAAALLGACAASAQAPADNPAAPAAAAPTGYPGGTWEPGPARFGSSEIVEMPVEMDDGVVLVARVSYPTDPTTGQRASGTFPVIIEHTPYDRAVPVSPELYFNSHGYIFATVRARGTGPSGGMVQYSSPRDGEDGKHIVEWAAHSLEGSDGRLALIGCSYPAAIALTDAAHLGPDSPVKAIVAACNGFHSQNRGTFMRAGLQNANAPTIRQVMANLVGGAPSAQQFFTELADSIESGGDAAYDREFWQQRLSMSLATPIAATGIPILLWSGWQDRVEGAVRAYVALQNAAAGRPVGQPMIAGQPTTPRYQLIMGDWNHAEGLDLGVYLQWIETWLKGVDTGLQRTARTMHTADPGTGGWVNLPHFPIAEENKPWFLGPSGTLVATAPGTQGSDQLIRQAPDQPGGKLSFATPPFAEGTTLSGPISATIYASSNKTNLMMIGRLYDVAPDGSEMLISMGAIVGSLRELDPERSWTDARGTVTWPWPRLLEDDYLEPGEVYRFDVALLSRQWSIKPGHRVRLDIMGESPAELCVPRAGGRSSGMDPCHLTPQQRETIPGGVYTIMHSPEWPSALNLPQVPFDSFAQVPSAIMPTVTEQREGERQRTPFPLPLDWEQ